MIAEVTTAPFEDAVKVRVTFFEPVPGGVDRILDTHGRIAEPRDVDEVVATARAACETLGIQVRP